MDYKGKIAFVSTWEIPCGIARFTLQLADAVESLGYSTHIFSFRNGHDSSYGDEKARYIANQDDSDYPYKFAEAIREWGADGVDVEHEYGIFQDSELLLNLIEEIERGGTKTATTFHSMFSMLTRHQAETVYNTLKRGYASIFPMQYQLKRLPGNFRRYHLGNGDIEELRKKVRIIPHGVPIMRNGEKSKDDYKGIFGLRGKKIVGMTRGWSLNKGFDRVIRMWPDIKGEVGDGWVLVVAGDTKSHIPNPGSVYSRNVIAQDRYVEDMYMKAYEASSAKDSIVLRRDIKPESGLLYDEMSAAFDIAVLPYVKGRIATVNEKMRPKHENVKGESQSGTACDVLGANADMPRGEGVMLVGSDIEGMGIQIRDSGGLAVEPGNDDALRSSLIETMRNEDMRRERYELGKRYAHDYSWDNVAEKVVSIFQ